MRIASQQCEALANDTQSHLHCCLWPKVAYGTAYYIEAFFSQDFKISHGSQIPENHTQKPCPNLDSKTTFYSAKAWFLMQQKNTAEAALNAHVNIPKEKHCDQPSTPKRS